MSTLSLVMHTIVLGAIFTVTLADVPNSGKLSTVNFFCGHLREDCAFPSKYREWFQDAHKEDNTDFYTDPYKICLTYLCALEYKAYLFLVKRVMPPGNLIIVHLSTGPYHHGDMDKVLSELTETYDYKTRLHEQSCETAVAYGCAIKKQDFLVGSKIVEVACVYKCPKTPDLPSEKPPR